MLHLLLRNDKKIKNDVNGYSLSVMDTCGGGSCKLVCGNNCYATCQNLCAGNCGDVCSTSCSSSCGARCTSVATHA